MSIESRNDRIFIIFCRFLYFLSQILSIISLFKQSVFLSVTFLAIVHFKACFLDSAHLVLMPNQVKIVIYSFDKENDKNKKRAS